MIIPHNIVRANRPAARDNVCHREPCCLARQQPERNALLLNFAKSIVNPMNRCHPLSHNFPRAHHTPSRCPSITFAAWGARVGKVGCGPESNGEKLAIWKLPPLNPHVETAQHACVSALDHFQDETSSVFGVRKFRTQGRGKLSTRRVKISRVEFFGHCRQRLPNWSAEGDGPSMPQSARNVMASAACCWRFRRSRPLRYHRADRSDASSARSLAAAESADPAYPN